MVSMKIFVANDPTPISYINRKGPAAPQAAPQAAPLAFAAITKLLSLD